MEKQRNSLIVPLMLECARLSDSEVIEEEFKDFTRDLPDHPQRVIMLETMRISHKKGIMFALTSILGVLEKGQKKENEPT